MINIDDISPYHNTQDIDNTATLVADGTSHSIEKYRDMFNGLSRKVLTKKKSNSMKGKKDKFLKNLKEEICQGDQNLSSFVLSASFSLTR